MPTSFKVTFVSEILKISTDKIECNGLLNNWKVFFRVPAEGVQKHTLRVFTFRIKAPLLPPDIIEDTTSSFGFPSPESTSSDFNVGQSFAYDFSYKIYPINSTHSHQILLVTHNDPDR